MAEKKKHTAQDAIGVYERTTGKKYKTGISADAVKSREAYKAWASSPAGKKAWGEFVKSSKQKAPAKTEAPKETPKAKAPRSSEGQPASAGAKALGGRTVTKTSKGGRGTSLHERGERRRLEKVEKDVARAATREKLQGTAAAKPTGGIGDVAAREKKKKKGESDDDSQ